MQFIRSGAVNLNWRDKPVCNPPSIPQEYEPFSVAEQSPLEKYGKPGQLDWREEEIDAIRKALKKLAILRICNAEDVEDLVQETLLTLVAKPPANALEKGLLVWSLGILRNKVGNYYRKANRNIPLDQIESDTGKRTQQLVFSFSPEANASDRELREILLKKVAELPPSQREVMELLVSGMESGEIVSKLQPERYQNVINRLYRGKKKLARELAKYGYGPGPATVMKQAGGKRLK